MKTLIYHTPEYTYFRQSTPKHSRMSKYKTKAARHQLRQMLRTLPFDMMDDLPEQVIITYYA